MDRFWLSQPVHAGFVSSKKGALPHYIPGPAGSSSAVMDGVLLETSSRQSHPCSAVEKWTNSGPNSPGPMAPSQHGWHVDTTQGYTLSPSQSPTGTIADEIPRLFPPYDDEWSSSLMTSTSSQLRPGLRRFHGHGPRNSAGWVRDPMGSSTPSGGGQPNPSSYTHALGAGAHHHFSDVPGSAYHAPALTASSPTNSSPSCPSSTCGSHSPAKFTRGTTGCEERRLSRDETEEDANGDPPYSLLIYRALRSAPGMKLPLQGIYSWFEKNTAKGRDRNSKGWQNSIRHNLSMNAGFEAVREESVPGKKAVNFWRLTDEAVEHGIQSTTRYRKQANYKKALGSEPPAPQRQRSGAKGGKATKFTARFRGSMSHEEFRRERCRQRLVCQQQQQQRQRPAPSKNIYGQYQHSASSTAALYHVSGPGSAAPLPRPSAEGFDLGSVVGCADPPPPCTPIFCDMAGSAPDCLALDAGFLGWSGIQPIPAGPPGLLTGPGICPDLPLGV